MGSDSVEKDKGAFGFLSKIFAFILGDNDPDREKKRMLRDLKKLLRKRGRYFKTQNSLVQPGFAQIFYDIYKSVGSAQVLLETAGDSKALKNIIIEDGLSDRIKNKVDQLTEERIREKSNELDSKSLQNFVKENLVEYFAAFTSPTVHGINNLYDQLGFLLQLIRFDYYFLLKKFDSHIPERDFVYKTRFEQISGEYILEDLKDFHEILLQFNSSADWGPVFEILKIYKGMEVIERGTWRKTVQSLSDLKKSNLIEHLIMYIGEDPYYKPVPPTPSEDIVEPYLNQIKTNSDLILQKIAKERTTSQIDKLLKLVFGTTAVSRLRNYSEKANMAFSKKMLGGFIYVFPLNYAKAFFLDYFKRDIKELTDLLIIRGDWSTKLLSQQLSENFQNLMMLSEELLKFDEALGEEGDLGIKLKNSMRKADRDRNGVTILRQQLKDINETAYRIIAQSAQELISIGKNLKMVIEDRKKTTPEIIVNWKELLMIHGDDLDPWMAEIYKKTYYFVQLLHIFLKKK